jgi:hypothetical protein
MAVGYSRRTSVQPCPNVPTCSASNSCRCASTPSLTNPGSCPNIPDQSCSISPMRMISLSPALLVTSQTVCSSSSTSCSVHGGLIQFKGLYARSSACTDTDPSALISSKRRAMGRCADKRPT